MAVKKRDQTIDSSWGGRKKLMRSDCGYCCEVVLLVLLFVGIGWVENLWRLMARDLRVGKVVRFVGGEPLDVVDEEGLVHYPFEDTEAKVVVDKTIRRSMSYEFVKFRDEWSFIVVSIRRWVTKETIKEQS
ncbi:hypothetical protein Syun_029582 [Stephania yunnanensis]|uniref:Uncharacterized protein n=1 Tax=Stephania yunnanensis TaxID=152371 RepID=A0AAP0EDG1_9MAGN